MGLEGGGRWRGEAAAPGVSGGEGGDTAVGDPAPGRAVGGAGGPQQCWGRRLCAEQP